MTRGYDTTTIEWTDGCVQHDQDAFETELVTRGDIEVLAYANRPASAHALFRNAVERAPERPALVVPDFDRRISYAELDDRVDRVAAGLDDAGIDAGDVVGLMVSNHPAFVETFLACARLGAVVAPINTRVSARELGYLLSDTDPAGLVVEAAFLSLLADTDHELPADRRFVVSPSSPPSSAEASTALSVSNPNASTRAYETLLEADGTPPDRTLTEDDLVAILYTSGTTGHPKGCPVSNFHLVNAAINYRTAFATDEGLRTMVTVPLFHVAGLTANLLHTLSAAGTIVLLEGASPETFLETIESERIEFVLDVPTNYVLAAGQGSPSEYDLSSLEIAAYGGAPMPAESIERLREAFPGVALCDAYGTTETVGGLVTMCPDEYTAEYAHTIGLPTPPMELAVVDEDREPLGPNELGELAIRGPIVVEAYLHRPDATAEAFGDGWHYTGDLAVIDEDGFVELKGRNRDKIVRGGENVYVLDVEDVLTAHENVLEASVTSFPDEVLGERVLAAVVPRPGVRLTEDELIEHCRSNLAEYKRPEIFRILDELPKNPGGKVRKDELVPEPLGYGIAAGE